MSGILYLKKIPAPPRGKNNQQTLGLWRANSAMQMNGSKAVKYFTPRGARGVARRVSSLVTFAFAKYLARHHPYYFETVLNKERNNTSVGARYPSLSSVPRGGGVLALRKREVPGYLIT